MKRTVNAPRVDPSKLEKIKSGGKTKTQIGGTNEKKNVIQHKGGKIAITEKEKKFEESGVARKKRNYVMYESKLGTEKEQNMQLLKEAKKPKPVEPRKEEKIIQKKKQIQYLDNYQYHETKDIKDNDPNKVSIVTHQRLGDIVGGTYEVSTYQKQTITDPGRGPKLYSSQTTKTTTRRNAAGQPTTNTTTTRTTTNTTRPTNTNRPTNASRPTNTARPNSASKPAARPAAKPTTKPAAKPTSRPAAKPTSASKPAAKPTTAKPAAKPNAAKPTAKPTAAKPAAKPTAAKPTTNTTKTTTTTTRTTKTVQRSNLTSRTNPTKPSLNIKIEVKKYSSVTNLKAVPKNQPTRSSKSPQAGRTQTTTTKTTTTKTTTTRTQSVGSGRRGK